MAAARSESKRQARYIPGPVDSTRRMGSARSKASALDELDGIHACWSVEPEKDTMTCELDRTAHVVPVYFVQAPDVPRKKSPFEKSVHRFEAKSTSRLSDQRLKYR